VQMFALPLDLVELGEALQRLRGDRIGVGGM